MNQDQHADLERVVEAIEAQAQELWKASKASTYLEGKADGLDSAARRLRRHVAGTLLGHPSGADDGSVDQDAGPGGRAGDSERAHRRVRERS